MEMEMGFAAEHHNSFTPLLSLSFSFCTVKVLGVVVVYLRVFALGR